MADDDIYNNKHKILPNMKTLSNQFDIIDSQPNLWKVYLIKWYDEPIKSTYKDCPQTLNILNKCPNLQL